MRKLIYIILVALLISCEPENQIEKPDNLLSKKEMSAILYDIYILNAAKGINKNLLEFKGVYPERYIFEKYNIDSLQFAKSNNYYAYDMDNYQEIIEEVRTKIKLQKEAVKKQKEDQESIRKMGSDSTRQLKAIDKKIIVPKIDSAKYRRKYLEDKTLPDN